MNKSNFRKRNGVFRVRVSPNSNLLAFKVLLCIFPSQTFWGFPCLKTFRWQIVYVNYTFFLLFPHLYILFQSNTHKYIQYYNKWLRKKDLFASIYFKEGNGTPLQYSCLENPMDWGAWKAAVHGVAEGQTWLSDFTFHLNALEKKMKTHSSVLAWRIWGTGEPGGLPSMGSHRVRHDWSYLAAAFLIYREIMYIPLNCMSLGWSKLTFHLIGQELNLFCLITLQDALIPTFLKQFHSPTIAEIITCFTMI